MKCFARRLTALSCLLTIVFTFSLSPASADETARRVLLLPLSIHAEKDLAFLNKGIMDMIASRIGQAATVIRKTPPDPNKTPIQLARDLNADFVVTGSVTIFGDSVSTDAQLTRVETGEAVLSVNQFGQSSGDVLMHVNQFGTQAGQYMASLAGPATPATAAAVAPQPAAPAQPRQQPPQPAVTAAPQAPAAPAPAVTPTPVVATAPGATVDPLWTSSPVRGTISALTVGDVNADGRTDLIYVHDGTVIVETKSRNRLNQLTSFEDGKNHSIIAVDAVDLNGNQTTEIFVTRLDIHDKLDSIVLEWNGSTLAPIATNQSWYFRVATDPEKGPVLLGQRRGTSSATDTGGLYSYTHFLPGIFELNPMGNGYQAGRRFPLPNDQNLYGFSRGEIFNDGKIRTVAYSPGDELRIYDPAGNLQWAGRETLGGTPLFLESVSSTDIRTKDKTYLSQRLVVIDIDGDGQVEVVTVHNRDAARGLVERFRKYTRGRMVALRWNKVNMKEIWTGEEISGYISDFAVADLNNDGKLEAVYAMVAGSGILQGNNSSLVIEQFGDLSAK